MVYEPVCMLMKLAGRASFCVTLLCCLVMPDWSLGCVRLNTLRLVLGPCWDRLWWAGLGGEGRGEGAGEGVLAPNSTLLGRLLEGGLMWREVLEGTRGAEEREGEKKESGLN